MTSFGPKTTSEEILPSLAQYIKGTNVLLTGCSPSSLAAETAKCLAGQDPARLILSARSLSKLEEVKADILSACPHVKIELLEMDLAQPKSIEAAAAKVTGPIDVLYNSAGVMAVKEFQPTGWKNMETQFAVTHLGHFYLTSLIKDRFSASPRIVNVTSSGHTLGPVLDDPSFDGGKSYDPWAAYGQAKTANCLFSVSLAEKYGAEGWTTIAVHPGAILESGIGRHMTIDDMKAFGMVDADGNKLESEILTWKTHSQGAASYLFAGFRPEVKGANGGYVQDGRIALEKRADYAGSKDAADKLWKLSEEICGRPF